MTRIVAGGPPRVIAHRGDPIGHRENTLAAVAAALRLGADLVEIDVRVTADGVVVLLHDPTLERLWGEPARVEALTAAEVAQRTGNGVPLLREAAMLVAGTGTGLLIDMDDPDSAGPALQVVNQLVDAGTLDPGEVAWCGGLGALHRIRRGDRRARILLSWHASGRPTDGDVAALAPEAFNPHWALLDTGTVSWARERGMATCCWTVDDEEAMGAVLDRGVDAVISNRVATLRRVVDDRG